MYFSVRLLWETFFLPLKKRRRDPKRISFPLEQPEKLRLCRQRKRPWSVCCTADYTNRQCRTSGLWNVWTGKTHRNWKLNVILWGAEERLVTGVNEWREERKKDKGNRKRRNEEDAELTKKKKHKRNEGKENNKRKERKWEVQKKKKEVKNADIWYLQGGPSENFFTWGNGAMQPRRYRQLSIIRSSLLSPSHLVDRALLQPCWWRRNLRRLDSFFFTGLWRRIQICIRKPAHARCDTVRSLLLSLSSSTSWSSTWSSS